MLMSAAHPALHIIGLQHVSQRRSPAAGVPLRPGRQRIVYDPDKRRV